LSLPYEGRCRRKAAEGFATRFIDIDIFSTAIYIAPIAFSALPAREISQIITAREI
jgi:hypothetical protein